MEKNYFGAIEFGSVYTIVLILNYHHNKLDVVADSRLLSKEYSSNDLDSLDNGYFDGEIINAKNMTSTIKNISNRIENKFKIKLDEVIIVLPNNDHKFYQADVSNKVLTERQIIGQNQISSMKNKIKNAKMNDGEVLVEDVPSKYYLDNNIMLRSAPIGYQSSTLTIKSNIHTLPITIYNPICEALKNSNIAILGHFLNCSCGASVTANNYELETECVYININQDSTTISGYNKNLLIRSCKVDFGLVHLIKYLAKTLNVSLGESLKLLESYFVCDIEKANDIVIDEEKNISENRVSAIILNKLYEGLDLIKQGCHNIISECKFIERPSYLVSGVLNDYEGFVDIFSKKLNLEVKGGFLNVIGLDSQIFINCYGAIKLYIERNPLEINKRLSQTGEIVQDNNDNLNNKVTNNEISKKRFHDIFDD